MPFKLKNKKDVFTNFFQLITCTFKQIIMPAMHSSFSQGVSQVSFFLLPVATQSLSLFSAQTLFTVSVVCTCFISIQTSM